MSEIRDELLKEAADADRRGDGWTSDVCQRAADEIERLRQEVIDLHARLTPQLSSNRLDVDNPLYEGLVLECLPPGVLATTVRYLKAERDDARNVVKELRDDFINAADAYPWMKEREG